MVLQVGDVFYDRENRKHHILAIIEGQIVYKYFGIHKRYWHYEIKDPEDILMRIKHGIYSMNRQNTT